MTQDFAKKKRTTQHRPATVKKTPKPKKSTPRKNARSKTNNTSSKAPTWAWLIIGLLLAALVTLLIYLANQPKAGTKTANPTAQVQKKTTTKPPQPRFDFYQILKEQEVEVPDRSSEITSSTPKNIAYYLQAGSFKSKVDADRLRVQLLLLNLETTIEGANNNSSTWHRVIVGPFKSRSKVAKARSILASKNLNPLLLKRKVNEP